MKICLVRQPQRPLSRGEAWACFTANIVMPGSGSLVAGRAVGYFQIVVALIGLVISFVATLQTLFWYVKNYQRLNASTDPLAPLIELGHHLVQPAIGLGVFLVAVSWALITSVQIIRSTPRT